MSRDCCSCGLGSGVGCGDERRGPGQSAGTGIDRRRDTRLLTWAQGMGTKTMPYFGARGCCWLLRGLIAEKGFRVPVGTFLFVNLRQLNYQTLENATGVGAPPWKWPTVEQVIDCCARRSTPSSPARNRRSAHYAGPTHGAKRQPGDMDSRGGIGMHRSRASLPIS